MKSILIVVHDYPPIRSTGSQRVLKFARYLPDFGYQPIILTTGRYGGLPSDEESGVYRANDLVHSLFGPLRARRAERIGQEQQFRVATVESSSILGRLRDRLMIPDTKLGWLMPAVRAGRRAIAERQPILVFSSSPPETTHLIAGRLSRAFGLPWVADLRDGWLFEPPNPAERRAQPRQWLEARMESAMVAQTAAVTTATAPIADDLHARYPAVNKFHTISNGYDAAEFAGLMRRRAADGTFLVVYTGALSASRQGTSPDAFFAALVDLIRRDPATPVRVHVVGDTNPREQMTAHALGLSDYVTFVPPVSNRDAHQHQLDADALLLITAPSQRSVATLKLFDYIGAGVPILALAQDNAAANIVETYGLGITAPPDDAPAIGQALLDLMRRQRGGATWPGFSVAQGCFERRALAGQLAGVFDACTGGRFR